MTRQKNGAFLFTSTSVKRRRKNSDYFEHRKTPLQHLIDLELLDDVFKCSSPTASTLSEEDRKPRTSPAAVVHNPSSNLKLASGIAPVATYSEQGIPVLFGDGWRPSNNNLNLIEEMHLQQPMAQRTDATEAL